MHIVEWIISPLPSFVTGMFGLPLGGLGRVPEGLTHISDNLLTPKGLLEGVVFHLASGYTGTVYPLCF